MTEIDGKAFPAKFFDRLRNSDEEAWKVFFERYDPLIRSVVSWKKWCLAPEVQEDVAQTVRAQLFKVADKMEKNSDHLDAFIKRTCVFRIIDEIRRQVRKENPEIPLVGMNKDGEFYDIPYRELNEKQEFSPFEQILTIERRDLLIGVVQQLREKCRISIMDFYMNEMSYLAMAEKYGVTTSTVGTRLRNCLEQLRALVHKQGYFTRSSH